MPDSRSKNPDYRWCPHREQYVAVSVCQKQASRKKRCLKCNAQYEQLSLDFQFPKKPRIEDQGEEEEK